MAFNGNDQILIKIAVLGITFSVICTMGLSILWAYGSDYDYESISGYRDDLIQFSGETMINQTPWVLTHVYTPWVESDGLENHIDDDGWLFGQEITNYADLNKSADISLDPTQKSSVPISVSSDTRDYSYVTGVEWWADESQWYSFITKPVGELLGADPNTYSEGTASIWSFTGLRFVFDPTLPFNGGTSSVDGSLSIVWYSYNNQEGLSGGLQIYGGSVLLSHYAATDIVAHYNESSAYATTYDFMFDGVNLTLSIRFDPAVIESGVPLLQAWSQGDWTMAISSVSAGNFYDVENSASFTSTAGSMIDTFVKIYTFDLPNVENAFAKMIIWLLVGLPMTVAMLCVTLRLVSAVKPF